MIVILARCVSLLLILLISPFDLVAQDFKSSAAENFQACVNGFSDCDTKQLSGPQRQVVAQASLNRNFQNCFYGFSGCYVSQLSVAEAALVARAEQSRNLRDCLMGIGDCDEGQLTDNERKIVKGPGTSIT